MSTAITDLPTADLATRLEELRHRMWVDAILKRTLVRELATREATSGWDHR